MRPLLSIIPLLFIVFSLNAQVKTGFVDELVNDSWDTPVGITFDDMGRAFVWEKDGKVFHLMNNTKVELIDIEEEVGSWYDNGMNGFALDPNYMTNGYIYLLYVVDRHHLMHFGTPNYNSNSNDYESATIGRITRYTVSNPMTNPVVDYNSRFVLVGSTISNGFPIVTDNHGLGSIVFGTDGSLLASNGDGANVHYDNSNSPFAVQARNDGILRMDEALNHMRVQDITSLSGKIIRIDPATGLGLPSNPFYDALNPGSGQSKVWAYGFRNPFRFTLKPETGSHYMTDGNPGVFVVGEVGWNTNEELNVIDGPGQNFGWPKYEGMTLEPDFGDFTPTLNGTHKLPIIEYPHDSSSTARARIGGQNVNFGTSAFNFPDIDGVSVIGGVFYTGTAFPESYHHKYFMGDYDSKGWIKTMDLDANNEPTNFEPFAEGGNPNVPISISNYPTCFAYNPVDGNIYYTRFKYNDINELRRIRYSPIGGNAPNAIAQSNKTYGASPLEVNFYGNLSSDPENNIVSYEWDFGDGSPKSTSVDPVHTFTEVGRVIRNVTLKVTDSQSNESTTQLAIHINNTPPIIISTSIDTLYSVTTAEIDIELDCEVRDLESSEANLTYEWTVELVHNTHSHVDATHTSKSANIELLRTPNDANLYYYRVNLKVTDEDGLSTEINKSIFFDINNNVDLSPPSEISNLKYRVINEHKGKIEWDHSTDDNGVYIYEVYKNDKKVQDVIHGMHYYYVNDQQNGIAASFKIVARDSSGKASGDKFIYFDFANPTCFPLASCVFTDSATTSPVLNLNATYSSSQMNLTWNAVNDTDFNTYEVLLNGVKVMSTASNNGVIDHFLFKNGWNAIQVQSMDNNNNRISSNTFLHWNLSCPDNISLLSPIDDYLNEMKLLKGRLSVQAVNKIEGTTSNINYISEGNIQLNPGFKVENGAVFKAEIKDCF
ncbi:Glucose/arabinose dehydrogenase, beta-propeller fold [Spirosomataceae bacterium TFI 002]|nr:Glucose/arabinose dehydrogenase, beta-propeller fold [Spirosomataceae bacterium TFI 002]